VDNRLSSPFRPQAEGVHLLLVLLSALSLSQPPAVERALSGERASSVERSRDLLAASAVLHAWDARRESAWASSDPAALRALYVPGSRAALRDVRLLREYDERRLVVRRLVTQVFELEVLHMDLRHLRLRVVDRVAGGWVGGRPLGTTRPAARLIGFRRAGSSWQVVSVTEPGPRR
jgi:hypothetical protein